MVFIPPAPQKPSEKSIFMAISEGFHHTGIVIANAGLSLYYAKLVLDAHGGTISVENNKPQGSIINIVLPLYIKPRPEVKF